MKTFSSFGERLRKLQDLWKRFGLPKPVSGDMQLGNHKKGEHEFTGELIGLYETSRPYYVVPTLEVIPPYEGGKTVPYSFVSPTRPASVVLPIINKKDVVLVRQYRPQLFTWFMDFPRGWVPGQENKALELLKRELPGLFMCCQVDFLGDLSAYYEDSGGRDSVANLYIVGFKTEMNRMELKDKLREASPREIKPMIFSLEELNAAEEHGMAVRDLHSATLWYRGKAFLRKVHNIPII